MGPPAFAPSRRRMKPPCVGSQNVSFLHAAPQRIINVDHVKSLGLQMVRPAHCRRSLRRAGPSVALSRGIAPNRSLRHGAAPKILKLQNFTASTQSDHSAPVKACRGDSGCLVKREFPHTSRHDPKETLALAHQREKVYQRVGTLTEDGGSIDMATSPYPVALPVRRP